MSTRSGRLLAMLGFVATLLPLAAVHADAPAPDPARLESLLNAHDVRNAIHASRVTRSDCLHTEAERGR
ncbi:MAG TPA: hypothetical protein VJQ52_07380 [Steroidobacteraceae bacterium]|nr:hypothetical protein [Steroidobacteraceae bacterium]